MEVSGGAYSASPNTANAANTAATRIPQSISLSHKDSFGQYESPSKPSNLVPKPSVTISHSFTPKRSNLAGLDEMDDQAMIDETVDADIDEVDASKDMQFEQFDEVSNVYDSENDIGGTLAPHSKKNATIASLSNPPTPTVRNASLSTAGISAPQASSSNASDQGHTSLSGHVGAIARSPLAQHQSLPPAAALSVSRNGSTGPSSELEAIDAGLQTSATKVEEGRPIVRESASKDRLRKPSRHLQESRNTVQNGSGQTSKAGGGSSSVTDSPTTRQSVQRSSRSLTSRAHPQLPHAENVKPAPPPAMYWSKVPVHGSVPRRSFRAHSACLSDEMLWLFGGCDAKGCFRDLWCFDCETMCWSKPKVTGDLPPARRAHSCTIVDKRLFVFAGGDGPYYFNDLYVFDTVSLRWTKPDVFGQPPSPRRAHTSNYYNGQLIIFGGGNGVGALNDVYSLDLTDFDRLEWRKIECKGKVPIGRGYHTSNIVDGKLIVIGGSDGHMSFDDIHILKLDSKVWYQVKTDESHNRLGHSSVLVGSYLFIVGGHNSHSYTPDILTLNLVNLQWESRNICGKKPPGRGYHQAWLHDSRLFVHGGFDGKEIFDDLYYIDLSACAYLPQITSFSVELDDE